MAFPLLAYFFSMVTALAIAMAALVGFGDSQLRTTRLPHYSAVSIIAGSDSDALTNSEKAKEAQRVAEARKAVEARRAAEAQNAKVRKNAKKQAMLARVRRYNALTYGYANQISGGARLFSYAPRLEHY
jgi:hypothetical protein